MFKQSKQVQAVSSKSQSVRPEVVSDVQQLDNIRIYAPSYLGFIDPTQTFLKMRVKMDVSRGEIVPDPLVGAHAFFRNVIVRDGTNTTTIESLEDYNARVSSIRPFTGQTDIKHKRALFEGVQPSDSRGNRKCLYYGVGKTLTVGAVQREVRDTNEIEVYMQLDSGLMKQQQILPIAAMQGLRFDIDTEDVLRSCVIQDDTQSITSRSVTSVAIAATDFDRQPGAFEFQYETNITTNSGQFNNHFSIGDKLYIDSAAGGAELVLGFITGFSINAQDKLLISFVPESNGAIGVAYPAGSFIYYKVEDRQKSVSYADETETTVTSPAPNYTLSDIELLCMTVQPPSGFIDAMMKASQTEKGIKMDFMGVELHRFNQVNTQGVTQVQIPTQCMRAKSLVVQPLLVSNYRTLSKSSFKGVPDDAENYQFIVSSELIPTRQVPLSRYSQAIAGTTQRRSEPLHMVEVQKAVSNIGERVFNLQKLHDHFVIARALNRYNQVSDLSDDSVSLRVEYGAAGSQKIFNSYVYKLSQLVISKGGVMMM